ncbi:MAG: hypothetical protein BMS9Abin13_274 [Patescibacteria group bacterium]|nr:MAG: hypothetical protein BMS9Abin13_274 [Patescibacteria group bacterium]
MKIRRKLHIGAIVSVGLALAISYVLFGIMQDIDREIKQNKLTDEIVKEVFDLNILTSDYLLYEEERARTQWELKYDSVAKLIVTEGVVDKRSERLLGSLRQGHKELRNIFLQLVAEVGGQPLVQRETKTSQELKNRLTSQLLVKLQSMVSDTFQLSESTSIKFIQKQQKANMFILVYVIVITLIIAAISLLIMRSVMMPIVRLQEELQMVGEENPTYKINTESKNEVGQLARSFSAMVEKVRRSHADLEKKIRERTEELEKVKTELEGEVTNRTVELEKAKLGLEKEVIKRMAQLQGKLFELERFQELTIDRELKMIKLKKEIAELKKKTRKRG